MSEAGSIVNDTRFRVFVNVNKDRLRLDKANLVTHHHFASFAFVSISLTNEQLAHSDSESRCGMLSMYQLAILRPSISYPKGVKCDARS